MSPLAGKLIALAFSLLILVNAYVVRRVVGTWLFPGCIFALFWFVFTFLPLTVLFSEPINPWPTAYLFVATVAFSISGLFYFRWPAAYDLNRGKATAAQYFDTTFLRGTFYLASALSLICFVLNMRTQGFSMEDMLLRSIDTAALYSHRRGTDDLVLGVAAKLGLATAYLAATLGGLLFGCSRSKRNSFVVLLGAFLPSIASLLFESAKGLLFQFIALFFGCVLVTRLFQGRLYLIDRAGVRNGILALLILLPLTIVSFFSRGLHGVQDSSVVAEALPRYFASYAFGHLYAFSDWFSFQMGWPASMSYAHEPSTYGFFTFASAFRVFGSSRTFVAGIYDEYFSSGLLTGNIYTMFRGLIIDFGMLGTLLYTFISGFAIHLSFYFLLARRRPTVTVAIFIYVIGYFYSSALVSLFIYNIIPASIVLLSACLIVNNRLSSWMERGVRHGRSSIASIDREEVAPT